MFLTGIVVLTGTGVSPWILVLLISTGVLHWCWCFSLLFELLITGIGFLTGIGSTLI